MNTVIKKLAVLKMTGGKETSKVKKKKNLDRKNSIV